MLKPGAGSWLVVLAALVVAGCPRVVGPGDAADAGDALAPGDVADALPMDARVGPDARDDVAPPDAARETDAPPPDATAVVVRTQATQGGAIAISADERVAVAANRGAHSVSVFALDLRATPPTATRVGAPLATGALSEPWSAVVSNDGGAAYVVLRRAQQVVRIDALRGTPRIFDVRAATGAEPVGVALAPSGTRLYVANQGDGTLTVVDTGPMRVVATIDLNAALAASGLLGTVEAHPALAHPRAVVITNDGDADDGDETAYVTEFFGQVRATGVPAGDEGFDVARQGVVYPVALGTGSVGPLITLAPVADTGFADSHGAPTGCFPNQLYAAALANGRLHVAGLCASPRGPTGELTPGDESGFRTVMHSVIFAVDTASNTERPAARVLLTREVARAFPPAAPDDDGAQHRVPLVPNDLAFVAGEATAYVSAYGSDALFRVAYHPDGSLAEVGSARAPFVNLQPGHLPIGVAIAPSAGVALVLNENTRDVAVVSLGTQTVGALVESAPPPAAGSPEANVVLGRRFFVTGLGRWSLHGQAWSSCEGCHPDGLTDSVTWFLARGPRRTPALAGTYGPDGRRRLLGWTANFDEVHDLEGFVRGLSGGVGAVVDPDRTPLTRADRIAFDGTTPAPGGAATATRQDELNGSSRALMPGAAMPASVVSARADWDRIDDYVRTIRAPRAPTNLSIADVVAGRALFMSNGCGGCHGGANWTLSRLFYEPGEAHNNPATGDLRALTYARPTAFPGPLNPPSLGAAAVAPLRVSDATGAFDPANDQINCILRAVGTFPAVLDAARTGIVLPGSPVRVREVRADMATPAQGATGYNPPSLLGLGAGTSYFHAGNARTLDEALSAPFRAHYLAFASDFLEGGGRADILRQLVAFLLSIDDAAVPVPAVVNGGMSFDLCPAALP